MKLIDQYRCLAVIVVLIRQVTLRNVLEKMEFFSQLKMSKKFRFIIIVTSIYYRREFVYVQALLKMRILNTDNSIVFLSLMSSDRR